MTDRGRPPSLHRDAFLALAVVAWADGRLDPDEADAIVRAAAEEGIELEELASVEQEVRAFQARPRDRKDEPDLSFLDRSGMTKEDRVFVYAVASWIAKLDGIITSQESDALRLLGERLGIPDRLRARAEELAKEIALLPDGDRPHRYDLAGLRRRIGDRLGPTQSPRTPG